jgi:hypothetical protein
LDTYGDPLAGKFKITHDYLDESPQTMDHDYSDYVPYYTPFKVEVTEVNKEADAQYLGYIITVDGVAVAEGTSTTIEYRAIGDYRTTVRLLFSRKWQVSVIENGSIISKSWIHTGYFTLPQPKNSYITYKRNINIYFTAPIYKTLTSIAEYKETFSNWKSNYVYKDYNPGQSIYIYGDTIFSARYNDPELIS